MRPGSIDDGVPAATSINRTTHLLFSMLCDQNWAPRAAWTVSSSCRFSGTTGMVCSVWRRRRRG
jgi:hypothetical protein